MDDAGKPMPQRAFSNSDAASPGRSFNNSSFKKKTFEIQDMLPELLDNLLLTFSEEKTIREVACDICRTLLNGLQKHLTADRMDFCALFGYFNWLDILKLKGAAGFNADGFCFGKIKAGEGFLGGVAQQKQSRSTQNLSGEKGLTKMDRVLAELAERVGILAYPLLQADGQLLGVLVIGKSGNQHLGSDLFNDRDFHDTFEKLVKQIATIYCYAIWVVQSKLAKKYVENERRMMASVKKLYQDYKEIYLEPKKFIDQVAGESLKLLNSGNPQNPYYKNYLFYEYLEYQRKFILRSHLQPKFNVRSISLKSAGYRKYIADGLVKSVESQQQFVSDRGKFPCVIRYVPHKIEETVEYLDEDWSPAGCGCAFLVPLFEGQKPLGLLVFLSRFQRRQYVNRSKFYLEKEKRKSSLNHLRYFRALQPVIAREYFKLKLEDRQRISSKLQNVVQELKEIIILENKTEVLLRLAEFTVESLGCEGCIIYLFNANKIELEYAASCGFILDDDIKYQIDSFLRQYRNDKPALPLYILNEQSEVRINKTGTFRQKIKKYRHYTSLFKGLKSKTVKSYLGRPISSLGVIELFNSNKYSSTGWSFFKDQDAMILRHVCDAIAAVLNRMETTESQVKTEKTKAISTLLLDISHELKNPLYSSLIFIRKLKQHLNDNPANSDNDEVQSTLNLIEANTRKAQTILKSMQSFQNMVTSAELEAVDLVEILQTVIQTNQFSFQQQHITVETDFRETSPLVLGRKFQFNQVFTNIVANAIDAMPDGGVLSIRIWDSDDTIHLEFTDNGQGIPPALQERIFDAFVTTKDSEQGRGLGLTLSRRIIQQHHGKIECESQEGKGTKFFIQLPKISP